MSDCPSTYCAGATIDTNSVASATLNKMDSVPAANTTASSCPSVSTPSAQQTGTVASSAHRPRSQAIISCRRRPRRSAQAPACIPNSRLGSHSSAVR